MKKATLLLLAAVIWMVSCKHEIINPGGLDPNPDSTGTGPNGSICFETDVLPIFNGSCANVGCHDAATHKEGLVLDTYEHIMSSGGIVPGNAAASKLYTVLFASGEERMPQNADPLSVDQKEKIAQWINEGATNTTNCNTTCNSARFAFAANVQPVLNTYCVSCHNGVNPAAYGNVDLRTWSSIVKDSAKIRVSIQWLNSNPSKNMPRGAPLPTCQKDVILNWLNAGAPNN